MLIPPVLRHAVAAVLVLVAGGCGSSALTGKPLPPPSEVLAMAPAEELYDLSPARVRIRRLAPQALRMLAPLWSRVRESDRGLVRRTLRGVLSEARLEPFARLSLRKAVAEHPELAAATLVWLRGPLGYEVKFAEAIEWTGDKQAESQFDAAVHQLKEEGVPDVRGERLRKLAATLDAVPVTLDLIQEIGSVVARLVNSSNSQAPPLAEKALLAAIERERRVPEVATTYESIVVAALMMRCRDLDLEELDRYIEFAATDAGRWYHQTLAAAMADAVQRASVDVVGVLAANAKADPQADGADLDRGMLELSSGATVRLLTIGVAGSSEIPTLLLRYESSLPMSRGPAVAAEASEVWDKVRSQVERDGAKAAVLQAIGSVNGWVFPFASAQKFAWQLAGDGSWARYDGGKPGFGQLERELLWTAPF